MKKQAIHSGKGQADFILTLNKLALVNFPTVDKEYSSSELWPFFVSRIPSRAQLQAPKGTERQDLVSLLKNYGRKTIANPYQLIPA